MSVLATERGRQFLGFLLAVFVLSTSRLIVAGENDPKLRIDDDPATVALRVLQKEPTIKAAIGPFTSPTQTLSFEIVDTVVAKRLPNHKRASFQFTLQDDKDIAIVWIHLFRNAASTITQNPWRPTGWSIDGLHYDLRGQPLRGFPTSRDMIEFVSSHKVIVSRVGQIKKIELNGTSSYAKGMFLFREEKDSYMIKISGSKGTVQGAVKYRLRGRFGKMKLIERTWIPLRKTASPTKK
jgi:hypothetical protein